MVSSDEDLLAPANGDSPKSKDDHSSDSQLEAIGEKTLEDLNNLCSGALINF